MWIMRTHLPGRSCCSDRGARGRRRRRLLLLGRVRRGLGAAAAARAGRRSLLPGGALLRGRRRLRRRDRLRRRRGRLHGLHRDQPILRSLWTLNETPTGVLILNLAKSR